MGRKFEIDHFLCVHFKGRGHLDVPLSIQANEQEDTQLVPRTLTELVEGGLNSDQVLLM